MENPDIAHTIAREEGAEQSRVTIDIENYPPATWRLHAVGVYLFVSASRKDGDTDYEFEATFKFSEKITASNIVNIVSYEFVPELSEYVFTFDAKLERINNKVLAEAT